MIYIFFLKIMILSCSNVGGKSATWVQFALPVTLDEASITHSPASCPASGHALSILPCMHGTTVSNMCANIRLLFMIETHMAPVCMLYLQQSMLGISCNLARQHFGDAERIRRDNTE